MPPPDGDGEKWLRDQWATTPEEDRERIKVARREGRTEGLIWGFLLGAIALPIGCNMLPDHLRQEMQKSFESDGSQEM